MPFNVDAFWTNVKMGPESECWEWQKATARGYGQVWVGNGKAQRAHRISYELANGPIPENTQICHRCDNPPCVNPVHLFAGTARENALDRDGKGRHWVHQGNGHPCLKVTVEQVGEIRRLWALGKVRQRQLAATYNIAQSTVSEIVTGSRRKADAS